MENDEAGMSRQIRISIDDDEVFERLKHRKDALDLSWEDALRRGLRDSPEPPRGPHTTPRRQRNRRQSTHTEPQSDSHRHRHNRRNRRNRGHDDPSPFDDDFGERVARDVLASVSDAVPGFAGGTLDDEIGRLEDAENAELVLGDAEGEHVPLRVALYTDSEGLDVEVVAVRGGKGTEAMNQFVDGARARVAERFARGETARLELDAGDETYDVRPELTWARGPDGAPTVTDVVVGEVVFEKRE